MEHLFLSSGEFSLDRSDTVFTTTFLIKFAEIAIRDAMNFSYMVFSGDGMSSAKIAFARCRRLVAEFGTLVFWLIIEMMIISE